MEQDTINNIVNKMAVQNTDMKGRRCVGASDAVDPQDYVTLNQLNNVIKQLSAVVAFPARPHQFLNSVSKQGVFTAKQPAFTDISGIAAIGQLPLETFAPTGFDNFIDNGTSDGRRQLNVIYHNTHDTPLYVTVSMVFNTNTTASSQCGVRIGSDATVAYNLTRFGVGTFTSVISFEIPMTFIVPVNWYYEVAPISGSVSVDSWYEWF
jgi:hypothetical protein